MLQIPLLHPSKVKNPIYYTASTLDGPDTPVTNVSFHVLIQKGRQLSESELLQTFTKDELSANKRNTIKDTYLGTSNFSKAEYNTNVSMSMLMYTKESGAAGDISVMAIAPSNETYRSENLDCEILIEEQRRMDGTYITYLSWVKNNVLYGLSGYETIENLKAIVETLSY